MTMSVVGLSIDCADAAALAGFWSEALGRPVNRGADAEHAAIDATDPARGPRLSFQKVPEPKTVKNRLHLDLRTDRFEAESDRLTGLGATAIRSFERPTIRWTTFADPEGNEFDLIAGQAPAVGEGHSTRPLSSAAHGKVTWSVRPPSGLGGRGDAGPVPSASARQAGDLDATSRASVAGEADDRHHRTDQPTAPRGWRDHRVFRMADSDSLINLSGLPLAGGHEARRQ